MMMRISSALLASSALCFLLLSSSVTYSHGRIHASNQGCTTEDLMDDCSKEVIDVVDETGGAVTLGEEDSYLEIECAGINGMKAAQCFIASLCKTHGQEPLNKAKSCIEKVCPLAKRLGDFHCMTDESAEEVKEEVESKLEEHKEELGEKPKASSEETNEAAEEELGPNEVANGEIVASSASANDEAGPKGHHHLWLFVPVLGLLMYAVAQKYHYARSPFSAYYSGIALSYATGREIDDTVFNDSDFATQPFEDEPDAGEFQDPNKGE